MDMDKMSRDAGKTGDGEFSRLEFGTKKRLSRQTCIMLGMGFLLLLTVTAVVVLAVLYAKEKKDNDKERISVCTSSSCVTTAARLYNNLDLTMDPCEDFYQFSCGGWLKRRVLKADQNEISTAQDAGIRNTNHMITILKGKNKKNEPKYLKDIRQMYAACMNTDRIEKKGAQPLKDLVNKLGGWPMTTPSWDQSTFDVEELASQMIQMFETAFLTIKPEKNPKDRSKVVLKTELAKPDEIYSLPRNDPKLMSYQKSIYSVAKLMGAGNETLAMEDAQDIVDFEIELSKVGSMTNRTDENSQMTFKDVVDDIKEGFDLRKFVNNITRAPGVSAPDVKDNDVFINDVDFKTWGSILKNTPKRVIANRMIWQVIKGLIVVLPKKFQQLNEQFAKIQESSAFSANSPESQWCASLIMELRGLAVGRAFVDNYFTAKTEEDISEMARLLQRAFNEIVDNADWLEPPTKLLAKEKNKAITMIIGYFKQIKDDMFLANLYKGDVSDDNFVNAINSRRDLFTALFSQLTGTDTLFLSLPNPTTVGAWNVITENTVYYAAGILQQLYYSPDYPKSLNFGGVGMVSGHEITHGFDNTGRLYDKHGARKQWWTDSEVEKFKDRAQCIVDQYDNFNIKEINTTINGTFTLNDNIADTGGLKAAYKAYRNWVAQQGKEEQPLPGLNFKHNQLFFINFGQIWCNQASDSQLTGQITDDEHSMARYRVIGAVQNSDDFSEVFQCKPDSPMNKQPKCKLW